MALENISLKLGGHVCDYNYICLVAMI